MNKFNQTVHDDVLSHHIHQPGAIEEFSRTTTTADLALLPVIIIVVVFLRAPGWIISCWPKLFLLLLILFVRPIKKAVNS